LDDPADDIDFTTLHNILYFIYIGCVNIGPPNNPQDVDPHPEGYPNEVDPFSLFRHADKFLLPSLKEICFRNLQYASTVKNIAERLFHPECRHHKDLQNIYVEFLVEHYEEVKETEGWKAAFFDGIENSSPTTIAHRMGLMFDITKKLRK
jgi:hypothetical protein